LQQSCQLVLVLVLLRLDYSNGVLLGLSTYLVRRVQSVLNASARLIHHPCRSNHITDVLVSLHWLLVLMRIIQYKITLFLMGLLHVICYLVRVLGHGRQSLHHSPN
jgi:hypothetical protein